MSGTLFFTSSESAALQVSHEHGSWSVGTALPGIYSCTLRDYGDKFSDNNDDDYEDDGEQCVNPQRVADGYDIDFPVKDGLDTMSLQFFLSSKNKKKTPSEENIDDSNNDDGNNYLYAASLVDSWEFTNLFHWEILRAIPNNPADTDTTKKKDLLFHTYFNTENEFDWNNCNFDCCPFTDDFDSNGYKADRDYHDSSFLHAYIRTSPRAYAVDERTGDIFIAWEGFYKNCNPTERFSAPSNLEWTIGVSRLKTHAEDPTCVNLRDENGERFQQKDLSNNFSRCTVPVSIAYVGLNGKDVALPYGGFAVIPAAAEPPSPGVKPRRSFLLSVFQKETSTTGASRTYSRLWAIPEGGDVTRSLYKRQKLSDSHPDDNYMKRDIWNGGNIRVHYNQQTGRPDHLCRSNFGEGIVCMPIEVTEDFDAAYVTVTGDEETFLRKDQVNTFCQPSDEFIEGTLQSALVTGLDVLWNEEDGNPMRIFFGCWGPRADGRLGSVDLNGENLTQMLPGAYSGDVVLLPRELDPASMGAPRGGAISRTAATSSKHDATSISSQTYGISIIGLAAVIYVCIALYGFYKKRILSQSSRSMYSTTANNNFNSHMELSVMSSSVEEDFPHLSSKMFS